MPDTITIGKNITIISDGSISDFDIATYFPGEVLLAAVKLEGGAGDYVCIRNATATGEIISRFTDSSGDGLKDTLQPPKWCKPFLVAAESSVTNTGVVILEIA
jgi:hypothetical protein